MVESELRIILKALDSALEVYHKHGGTLSAREISLKSMLMVIHTQVADQLSQEIAHQRE